MQCRQGCKLKRGCGVTFEEMKALPAEQQKAIFEKVGSARKKGKSTNYSAMYGVGAPKLARELRSSVKEAKVLLDAYWKKNWAVKAYADAATVKKVGGQDWVYNPVSRFWYSLRSRKDIWSTTNQGTGVYCFDTWIREFRKVRPQITGQMHDEVILEIKEGNRERSVQLLQDAIDHTNDKLKLNVKLAVSVQFGSRYSDIH